MDIGRQRVRERGMEGERGSKTWRDAGREAGR